MKIFALAATLLGSCSLVMAQPQEEFRLWPDAAPGARGGDPGRDVPTLTPFWPAAEVASGAAMVVCPGGGYGALAAHEGRDYALWLAERGVAAFVLKYRLGSHGYRHAAILGDAARAIRTVRANAEAWKIDAKRIGIMGSSAGGHLASAILTRFDGGLPDAPDPIERVSSRPDAGVLCYPVITMGADTHAGSKANLLGPNPDAALVSEMSSEKQVTAATPPCFIWHTWEDAAVKVENALSFALALREKGVPFDLHVYQEGAHGLGLGVRDHQPGRTDPNALLMWTRDLEVWLRVQKFVR